MHVYEYKRDDGNNNAAKYHGRGKSIPLLVKTPKNASIL